ncbi:hypothetical protein Nepgr_033716 [Nepenthes gracilis]|uniref:Uncharacterized protein n=1 Tax=Nepenthes gracilis TaxID=150966 RepID=A0AAD3Y6U2_NEPGR|nr:hypothetical protein Nepgr_033716 [Nepenthes gracilis]
MNSVRIQNREGFSMFTHKNPPLHNHGGREDSARLQGQHPEEQLPIFKPSKVPQNSPPANIIPDPKKPGPAAGQTIKGHSGKAS